MIGQRERWKSGMIMREDEELCTVIGLHNDKRFQGIMHDLEQKERMENHHLSCCY